jgi:hypothetical protein
VVGALTGSLILAPATATTGWVAALIVAAIVRHPAHEADDAGVEHPHRADELCDQVGRLLVEARTVAVLAGLKCAAPASRADCLALRLNLV